MKLLSKKNQRQFHKKQETFIKIKNSLGELFIKKQGVYKILKQDLLQDFEKTCRTQKKQTQCLTFSDSELLDSSKRNFLSPHNHRNVVILSLKIFRPWLKSGVPFLWLRRLDFLRLSRKKSIRATVLYVKQKVVVFQTMFRFPLPLRYKWLRNKCDSWFEKLPFFVFCTIDVAVFFETHKNENDASRKTATPSSTVAAGGFQFTMQ